LRWRAGRATGISLDPLPGQLSLPKVANQVTGSFLALLRGHFIPAVMKHRPHLSGRPVANQPLLSSTFPVELDRFPDSQQSTHAPPLKVAVGLEFADEQGTLVRTQCALRARGVHQPQIVDLLQHSEPLAQRLPQGSAELVWLEFALPDELRLWLQRTLVEHRLEQFGAPLGSQHEGVECRLGGPDRVELLLEHVAVGPALADAFLMGIESR